MNRRVVVTGANRGLGLELVRCYRATGHDVWGGCRRPAEAHELRSLTEHVLPLDLGSEASIERFAAALGAEPIDVLVNNGGVDARAFGVRDGDRGVLELGSEHIVDEVRINAVGPLLLTRAVLDRLRAGQRPRVANISSQVGSMVVAATVGRDIGYAMSKAAMNMASVKLAGRLGGDGVVVVSMHPGFLRTEMGGAHADLDPADAAAAIVATVDGLTLERSGSFLRWDGTTHPW